MKKLFRLSAISLSSLLLLSTNANATSYQIFSDLNFSNPAALNSIQKQEFVIGGTGVFQTFHFTGTALGVNGSTTSNTNDLLPYARAATRLSPKVVLSFDITQPYFTNIQYPQYSFINAFATETVIRDYNYSPKLSFQVNDRLALGVGFDANNLYNGQLNFAVPPNGNMTNKASSWAYGFDLGLFYTITRATFLNLSYYSKIVQHASGTSTWGSLVNSSLSADVKLPATWIINLVQLVNPRWALSATVRYAQWDTLRYTVLQNTPIGTITVPDHFYNNVSTEIATHYQFNNQWAGLAAFDYEPNVQPTYTRNPGLPTYTRYYPAIGAEYEFIKGLKAKLIYAYVWSRAPINMNIAPGVHIQGHDPLHANVIDFSLTYDT